MSKFAKLCTCAGLLLFATAVYCRYWTYTRGASGITPVQLPVRLEENVPVSARFSVAEKGDHDVEIEYSSDASDDVGRDLDKISGKATLTCDGAVLAQAKLPVEHGRFSNGHGAMVLFTVSTKPRDEYVLLLQISRLPPTLARSQASVKVELDPNYYFLFWPIRLLSVLLLLSALLCMFPLIRYGWRMANGQDRKIGV